MFSYEPDSSHGYINDSEKVDPATVDSAKDRKPQKAGLLMSSSRLGTFKAWSPSSA